MDQSARPPTALVKVADAVLMAGALLCLATLAYLAYFYYWTAERQFVNGFAHAAYVAGPAIAGALLIAARALPPSARANLALSLCSVGVTVYAVELAATIWFSLPSVQYEQYLKHLRSVAAAEGREFDARSVPEVVQQLRGDGQDAFPSIFPRGLVQKTDGRWSSIIRSQGAELLPLASVSKKPTVVCNEDGEYLVYVSDEHGFHNPPGLWQAGVEVLSLGDSFTQGWCVPSERNFVSHIRARYPTALNLGMEANGPLSMLAALREYGAILKPRVVLWFYFEGNDLSDLQYERETPLMRRYLESGYGQRLIERQPEIDAALRRYIDGLSPAGAKLREMKQALLDTEQLRTRLAGTFKLSTLRSRLNLVGGAANPDLASTTQSNGRARLMVELYELFGETLDEARRSVESWEGRLYFVYLPSRDRWDSPVENPDRDAVLALATGAGLPIIDVVPAFGASGDPTQFFPFRTADHYNEAGHELVARTVLSALSH